MGAVILGEGEACGEVLFEHGGGVDGLHEGSINGLLVSLALVTDDGRLPVGVEKLLLVLSVGLAAVLEIVIVDRSRNGDLGDIDLGGGGNDVGLVDALEGDTVRLEGSGNEEEARGKDLEDDCPLSTEPSTKKDNNNSRGDGGAGLGGVLVLAALLRDSDIVGRVEPGCLSLGSDGLGSLLGSTGENEGANHYFT